MSTQFGKDLTEGSIPKHLLLFSIPMLAGNAMQIGYGLINTIWVGHLVGENAVGAVGVSLPVLYVLFGFAMGMSIATTIVVSQYYGAKDYRMVEKAVGTAFSLSLVIGSVLTISAILSSDLLLRLMATPPENFTMASTYLKINLAGFMLFYLGMLINFTLRGIGDTLTPLVFMSVGLGLNAVLDPFFIGGFGPFPRWGLNGAAYATVVSQATALTVAIIYLNRKNHLIAFHPKKLVLDRHLTFLLFKIGLPSIVQQSLVSIGSLFIVDVGQLFRQRGNERLRRRWKGGYGRFYACPIHEHGDFRSHGSEPWRPQNGQGEGDIPVGCCHDLVNHHPHIADCRLPFKTDTHDVRPWGRCKGHGYRRQLPADCRFLLPLLRGHVYIERGHQRCRPYDDHDDSFLAVAVARKGARLVAAIKDPPWTDRDMDRRGLELCGDHDSQPSLLLFGKVEKINRYQGSCAPSAGRMNPRRESNPLCQPKPAKNKPEKGYRA